MNYQNIPSEDELLLGIVARENYTYYFFDYSQIEIRFAAWYTKDPLWIKAYNNDEDVHKQTGHIIFGRHLQNKKERKFAKGFNFAMAYGAGRGRIAQLLAILYGGESEDHIDRAIEMLNKFHKKHPTIKNFKYIVGDRMMSDTERQDYFIHKLNWRSIPPRKASYRGHIKNRFDRRYAMPSNIQYKSLEWITSGDAGGDFHTKKFVEVSEFFEERKLNGGPCALIHDAIVCEIEDIPYQDTIVQEIKLIMEDDPEITKLLPLKVDVEYGKNWLEKKEWHYTHDN